MKKILFLALVYFIPVNAQNNPCYDDLYLSLKANGLYRKLLVSKKEMARLWNATAREGMTIVPLKMYFNDRGKVKILIGIAKGKKNQDKRETEAKRDWNRQKQRLLKQNI